MEIRRSATELVIQTPAKLNLFFEVLAKRTDGFHEIESLMCPIDLYDTLYFRDEPGGKVQFRCRWMGATGPVGCGFDQVPDGPDNLVVRAVELARRKAGVQRGAHVLLVKRIPAAAGLGGGSSDAAAALVAANEVWQLGRSRDQLAQWAAELGSDVPFFLADGPAVCRGRGEQVMPLIGIGGLHFVLVRPPEGLGTAAVYRACRATAQPRSVEPFWEALKLGDLNKAGQRLRNALQPAAAKLSPWVKRLEQEFARLDLLGHAMSGSGTSYFGLCRHARHARRSARRLRASGVGTVFAVRSCR
ncbi:MAG: 4-(cytidine 5'-diphospho)-2-C-methyl-D-erythritol kinase [Planctomycetaceae bacterium]|nr:4-(cytidine 5'-diphospho)-2-C-methyl-D-erythritol kinase [Planctomycetaceae bacterium]